MNSFSNTRICVLIRVYNRTQDLVKCIDIIRQSWNHSDYHILVVSNGKANGFIISPEIRVKADQVIELENNAGHLKGNTQLLQEGIAHIPPDCEHTIILEADTWIYGDTLIQKYIEEMNRQKTVWASAQWYAYVYSLATDFAIISTWFLKAHPALVEFERFPEYYVANYLKKEGYKPIYIREIGPINLPVYVRRYPLAYQGRFCSFPKAKMVTHHIEDLKNGMNEKMIFFNIISGIRYFDVEMPDNISAIKSKMRLSKLLYYLLPHRSWLMLKREKNLK